MAMASHSWDVLSRLPRAVPDQIARWADAWQPDARPVGAAKSASVVLLRDGVNGLETYLLHRHPGMSFAASMVVFPGGRVEPVDGMADPIRECARRETDEETGVLLRIDELHPWAHWTTPEVEPRRYDTYFFLARLPPGAEAHNSSGEATSAEWAQPGDALAAVADGTWRMMPPTVSIISELADRGSVDDALAAARMRTVAQVLPKVIRDGPDWVFTYPQRMTPQRRTVERLAPYLIRVQAPNPGPMTLDGTNSYLLGDPDRGGCFVVDPGPLDENHLVQLLTMSHHRVAGIVLTHRHHDHSDAAASLADRAGCAVWAADPAFRQGTHSLADGDTWEVAGARVRAVATPGHTSDSRTLLVHGEDGRVWLLTGDTVLGRGTSVVTFPDGNLGDYLDSLNRLGQVVAEERVAQILPGHGPCVADPGATLTSYREHRLMRLEQVRAALAAGHRTAVDVVRRVYADVDPALWPAAEQSVAAQLEFLASSKGRQEDPHHGHP